MITHTSGSHQIKIRQSQSYKFKKIAKNSDFEIKFCKKLYTQHTFWNCLIRCITMKWIQPELREGRTDLRIDQRMDGRSETNIPQTTSLCVGYTNVILTRIDQISIINWH